MKTNAIESSEDCIKPLSNLGRLAAYPAWLATFALLGVAMLIPGHTSAAGGPAPTEPMSHVDSVSVRILTLPSLGARHKTSQKYGRATVVIVDDFGDPVEGAKVTGEFTGNLLRRAETVSRTTDVSGTVILDSKPVGYDSGPLSFTFRVTGVQSSLFWDGEEVWDTASY